MVFQLHKDIGGMAKATIFLCSLMGVYHYDMNYGPRKVFFEACGKGEDFISELASEAKKRKIVGRVQPYDNCCARGVMVADIDVVDGFKTWLAANSTPVYATGDFYTGATAGAGTHLKEFTIERPKEPLSGTKIVKKVWE